MAKLLCNWLNNDIKLSSYLHEENFVSELSTGYLFGEVFHNHGLQSDFAFFSKEKNLDAILGNFSRLEPTFRKLAIKMDASLLRDVINKNTNSTTELLNAIFGALGGRHQNSNTNNNMPLIEEARIKELQFKRLNLAKRLKDQELKMPGTIAKTISGSLTLPRISPKILNNNTIFNKTMAATKEAEELKLDILKFETKKSSMNLNTNCSNIVIMEPRVLDDRTYVEQIRENLQANVEARKQREHRRKQVLFDHMNAHMQQQNELREELLVKQLLRQSVEERRIAVQLMHARHEKQVLISNRLQLQKDIDERRKLDFQNFLDREAELLRLSREEHAEELAQQQATHEKLRQQRREVKHDKHLEICRRVVSDVVDLSTKIADYREFTGCLIPSAIYCNWLELFLHQQPLYLPDVEETPLTKIVDEENNNILNEIDFNDYRMMKGDWEPMISCDEDGSFGNNPVLGNIIKNIYNIVYPPQAPEKAPEYPSFKIRACILGKPCSGKTTICNFLAESLNICVVSAEHLLKACMEANEKQETEDYEWKKIIGYDEIQKPIDEEVQINEEKLLSTEEAVVDNKEIKKASGKKEKEDTKKEKNNDKKDKTSGKEKPTEDKNLEKDEKTDNEKPIVEEQIEIEDRYEIVKCSRPTAKAMFGARIMTCLEMGQPIGDELVVEIIAQEIKALPEGVGWVLDGFPTTFNQLGLLESALTNCIVDDLKSGCLGLDVPPADKAVPKPILVSDPRPPPTPPPFKSGLDLIVLLDVPDQLSIRRSVGPEDKFDRPKEGIIYNSEFLKTIDYSQVQHKLCSFEEEWPKIESWIKCYGRLEAVPGNEAIEELESKIDQLFQDVLQEKERKERLLEEKRLEEDRLRVEQEIEAKKQKELAEELAKQEEEKLLAEAKHGKKKKVPTATLR